MHDSLQTLAADVARAILPNTPLYVRCESQGLPSLTVIPDAMAVTGRKFDLVLEDYLRERDEWEGRRPAIVIYDQRIQEISAEHAESAGVSVEQLGRELTIAAVSHEIGHVVDYGIDTSEPAPAVKKLVTSIAACRLSDCIHRLSQSPPFFQHAGQWIRCALHAWHRAQAAGFVCPVEYLYNGELYQVAQPERFHYAIGMELENLANVDLLEIPRFRVWENFKRLWQACVSEWINEHPDDAEGVVEATELLEINQRD